MFYLPFWQTGIGGTLEVSGTVVAGTQNIFFAQLADPNTTRYYEGISRFMSGRFITMMFGLIGASLAIYQMAKRPHKKVIGSFVLSAALTSFLTGITEPLEFSFLFVAPVLYIVHAIFDGLAFAMAHIFEIRVGQTFSGGFIDFILFGVLQGNAKTNYLMIIPLGVLGILLYYFSFSYLIKKFDFKTPGREVEINARTSGESSDNGQFSVGAIITALGGADNLTTVDCCATRLRVAVRNPELVDEVRLKRTGSKGVVHKGLGIQVIYGPHVTVIKNEIEEFLGE